MVPTINEVTELRRAGKIEEALQGAELLFSKFANKFTAGALFWVLFDLARKEVEKEKVCGLFERMKLLALDHCRDDSLIQSAFNSIKNRVEDPLCQNLIEGVESAKKGYVDFNLIQQLKVLTDSDSLSDYLKKYYGWLLYYSLKSGSIHDIRREKLMLLQYLKLKLKASSYLHSLMLHQAIILKQNNPSQFKIYEFMKVWGWQNLNEQDWQQHKFENDNIIFSNVEKLISLCVKEVKECRQVVSEEFNSIVDQALEKFKNNPHLYLHKAIILINNGKREEALDYYRIQLVKYPTKSYLWHQASNLVGDPDLRMAFLCKAVTIEKNDEFKGNSRLKLAELLIQKGWTRNARYELDQYHALYEKKGWHLSYRFTNLFRQVSQISPEGNKELYHHYLPIAEDFVYRDVEKVVMVKLSEKLVEVKGQPGRKVLQWTLRKKEGVMWIQNPSKFSLNPKTPNGTALEVRVYEGKILYIKKIKVPDRENEWLKNVEGELSFRKNKKGGKYGVVAGCYVAEKLLIGLTEGDKVKATLLLQDNGLWSVLTIKRCE